MKNETRVALLWPGLLMLSILIVSGATRVATPELGIEFSKDKLAHFLVFGLLATTFLRTPALRAMGLRGVCLAILLTASFGGLDEFRQSFTPGRSVEFADWIADACGAIVASLVYHYWSGYRKLLEMTVQFPRNKAISDPKGDGRKPSRGNTGSRNRSPTFRRKKARNLFRSSGP